jgi:hypothetical protein
VLGATPGRSDLDERIVFQTVPQRPLRLRLRSRHLGRPAGSNGAAPASRQRPTVEQLPQVPARGCSANAGHVCKLTRGQCMPRS